MKLASHAEAAAAEFISKFGRKAKHQAIQSLVKAIGNADKSGEELMRDVFDRIMLAEQKIRSSKLTPLR